MSYRCGGTDTKRVRYAHIYTKSSSGDKSVVALAGWRLRAVAPAPDSSSGVCEDWLCWMFGLVSSTSVGYRRNWIVAIGEVLEAKHHITMDNLDNYLNVIHRMLVIDWGQFVLYSQRLQLMSIFIIKIQPLV